MSSYPFRFSLNLPAMEFHHPYYYDTRTNAIWQIGAYQLFLFCYTEHAEGVLVVGFNTVSC